jgi:hypothetical protein
MATSGRQEPIERAAPPRTRGRTANRDSPRRPAVLARWLDGLRTNNADRTLSIDDSGAIACGRLMARRPLPVPIGLITATARVTLVTRNLADLVDTDVGVVTPWAQ